MAGSCLEPAEAGTGPSTAVGKEHIEQSLDTKDQFVGPAKVLLSKNFG